MKVVRIFLLLCFCFVLSGKASSQNEREKEGCCDSLKWDFHDYRILLPSDSLDFWKFHPREFKERRFGMPDWKERFSDRGLKLPDLVEKYSSPLKNPRYHLKVVTPRPGFSDGMPIGDPSQPSVHYHLKIKSYPGVNLPYPPLPRHEKEKKLPEAK